MRTLYQQQHALSNDFGSIRAKNTGEFRGAARGVRMSSNFRTFALIFYNYRPRCGDLSNYKQFAAFVQKRLDTRPRCGYNGAGSSSQFYLAFALAPARQKSRKIKIFGILAGRIFKGLEALVYKVE